MSPVVEVISTDSESLRKHILTLIKRSLVNSEATERIRVFLRSLAKGVRTLPSVCKIGGLIAAPALLFVLFGPDPWIQDGLHTNLKPSGLANLGQTCFLNAILQALSSCQSFVEWTPHAPTRDQIDAEFVYLLSALLKDLSGADGGEGNTQNLSRLLDIVRRKGWVIEHDQQDAHELYHALVNILHGENSSTDSSLPSPSDSLPAEPDCHKGVLFRSGLPAAGILRSKKSPILGSITTQMRCHQCLKKKAITVDSFSNLSLQFPPRAASLNVVQLDEMLRYYFVSDIIHGVECEHCTRAAPNHFPVRTMFSKEISIGKMPQCLCLHIQRLTWHPNGSSLKRHDVVIYPMVLDMYQCSQLSKLVMNSRLKQSISTQMPPSIAADLQPHRYKYRLVSLIEHQGNEQSGHFVTYRKYNDNRWMYVSDLDVREVSGTQVLSRSPYMLFYERTDLHNQT